MNSVRKSLFHAAGLNAKKTWSPICSAEKGSCCGRSATRTAQSARVTAPVL